MMMDTIRHGGAVLSTNSPEYLVQLLKDKRQLQTVPGCFVHLERILDEGEPSASHADVDLSIGLYIASVLARVGCKKI